MNDLQFMNKLELHVSQGRGADAFRMCQEFMVLHPERMDIPEQLAYSLAGAGLPAEAASLLGHVAVVRADDPALLGNLGVVLTQAFCFQQAIEVFHRALRWAPNSAPMHYNLGNAQAAGDNLLDAIRSYRRAIQLDPAPAIVHNNLGVAYRKAGNITEAIDCLCEAVRRDPGFSDAHANLGYALVINGQHAEGVDAFKRALLLMPGNPVALRELPQALMEMGEWPEAFAYYLTAERNGLASADLYNDFGAALLRRGYTTKALERFWKSIEIEPGFAQAHVNLAWTLVLLKRFDEAILSASRALELAPELPLAESTLLLGKRAVCAWVGLESLEQRVLERATVVPGSVDPLLFLALRDDPAQQRVIAHHNATLSSGEPWSGTARRRGSGERICVAYMSADFREHPVGVSLVELLERHDRSQFEVILIMLGASDGSAVATRIIGACDRYIDACRMSDAVLVSELRELRIDIMVDLMGHTAGARHNVLALRPADQTICYLGYPGTVALPYVDYILADRHVVPVEMRSHYDEAIIQLPHSYFPTDTSIGALQEGVTRRGAGLPEREFVFCGFCNLFKLSPQLFSGWMNVLRDVEGAVLWMQSATESARANLRQEAAARGIDPKRLIFAERTGSRGEYLARLQLADLFLDTWPYNAHSTARDALWAGLPVVTCEGDGFAARVAGSLLRTLGLDELVASNLDHYQELAIALATDAPRLARLRGDLAVAKVESPLFTTQRLCRNIESAYSLIVERLAEGLRPEDLVIKDSDANPAGAGEAGL